MRQLRSDVGNTPILAPNSQIVSSNLAIYPQIGPLKSLRNWVVSMLVTESSREWTLTLRHTRPCYDLCFSLSTLAALLGEEVHIFLSGWRRDDWGAGGPRPRNQTSMTSMVPLHLGGQKPFSASKLLKIEVLRGAKPKTSATKKTGGFHLAKKTLLKASSSLSEGTAQTVCIERGSAAVSGDAIVCLTALIWAHLPAGKVFPFSLHQPTTDAFLLANTLEAAFTYLSNPMLMCALAGTYLCFPALLLRAAYFRFY